MSFSPRTSARQTCRRGLDARLADRDFRLEVTIHQCEVFATGVPTTMLRNRFVWKPVVRTTDWLFCLSRSGRHAETMKARLLHHSRHAPKYKSMALQTFALQLAGAMRLDSMRSRSVSGRQEDGRQRRRSGARFDGREL